MLRCTQPVSEAMKQEAAKKRKKEREDFLEDGRLL